MKDDRDIESVGLAVAFIAFMIGALLLGMAARDCQRLVDGARAELEE